MITLKELQYVESWATKAPMPGEEYSASVMKNLEDCYSLYDSLYKDKDYNIIFSNGEEINFAILSSNLCHMLGIDYTNIKGEYFNDARKKIFGTDANDFSSYDLVGLILENAEEIIKNDNNPHSKAKFLNYFKCQIKSEIFNKLGGFCSFNYGTINEGDGKKLYVPSGELSCPYFFTCIRKDEALDKFIVTSLLAPTSPEDFFKDKEVVIPTQMIISDQNHLNRIIATPKEKLELLRMYKNIINKYSLENKMNIQSDYEGMLCASGDYTLTFKKPGM